VADADLCGDLALEAIDLGAEDVVLAVGHTCQRRENVVAQRVVLMPEVEKRDYQI
jgi:hypothetical protein